MFRKLRFFAHGRLPRAITAGLLGVAALLILPDAALAWGPGVHMVTGNWLLQNLTALPAGLATAIMSHPGLFLQGCLSADIFIGKGCVAKEGHSHNWSTGLNLLERAHTKQKLAYAAGYLSHLAADTVAHNVFVPGAFGSAPGKSINRGKLAHVYLEIQADNSVAWDRKDALDVFRESGSRGAERMLVRAMGQKSWLFWVKKHLFRSSIGIGGRKSWRASMQVLDSALNGARREADLQALLTISTRAMVDLLRDPYNSVVRALDPVGTEALADAAAGFLNPQFPSVEIDLPLIPPEQIFDPAELESDIAGPGFACEPDFCADSATNGAKAGNEWAGGLACGCSAPDRGTASWQDCPHCAHLENSIFSLPRALLELPVVCGPESFRLKSPDEVAAASLSSGISIELPNDAPDDVEDEPAHGPAGLAGEAPFESTGTAPASYPAKGRMPGRNTDQASVQMSGPRLGGEER